MAPAIVIRASHQDAIGIGHARSVSHSTPVPSWPEQGRSTLTIGLIEGNGPIPVYEPNVGCRPVIVSTLNPSRKRRVFLLPSWRPLRRKLLDPKRGQNGRLAPPKDCGIQALQVLSYHALNRRPQNHLTISVQRDDFFGIKVQCVCSIAALALRKHSDQLNSPTAGFLLSPICLLRNDSGILLGKSATYLTGLGKSPPAAICEL